VSRGDATVAVDRAQALAYRVVAQGLDRPGDDVTDLAILDLGIQDSPSGTAAESVAARTPPGAPGTGPGALTDGRRWLSAWSVRGAPHVMRKGDVRAMALATWPADPADAAARLAGYGAGLRKRGDDALEALRAAAEGLAGVVDGRMTKGEASTAVTKALPAVCNEPCRACGVVHISDQLMRLAGLPAGVALVPYATPATLTPLPQWQGVPERQEGAGALVEAYLRLHGPATPKDVAAYLQTTQAAVKAAWPDALAEVTVDGRTAWLPEDRLDALRDAPRPELVRLLPRSDPWLMGRDRERLVPGAAHRKALWPVIGFPGGVLVDGEVVGTWRTRSRARGVAFTVEPFARITKKARKAVEREALLVAELRGADDAVVTYGD
jgi:Winged helix DNA-binding domain